MSDVRKYAAISRPVVAGFTVFALAVALWPLWLWAGPWLIHDLLDGAALSLLPQRYHHGYGRASVELYSGLSWAVIVVSELAPAVGGAAAVLLGKRSWPIALGLFALAGSLVLAAFVVWFDSTEPLPAFARGAVTALAGGLLARLVVVATAGRRLTTQ